MLPTYSAPQTFRTLPLPLHKTDPLFQYRRPRYEAEPDAPDSIYRDTEERAFRNIAVKAGLSDRVAGRKTLSHTHIDLLRLERCAMQYLPPYYAGAEIAQWVADAYAQKFRARLTVGQAKAFLDQAGYIMLAQELAGSCIVIEDYSEREFEALCRPARQPRKPRRQAA